ncbi:hypothetical protein DSO57_1022235 [Entomophthora muscae]|uniref:Uncharacterized protein n=1 Tax=Entomophthora muscae TaxID=34485 RepID=A0ACC2TEM0_9FUNG|nr:hypothetical protein DSO57_1022235 [Entomophthora muscae]
MTVFKPSTLRPITEISCPHTLSATNGAHYRGPMYSSVEEDSTFPSPLLNGFHERYDGVPMETSDIKRDHWFCQEEEIINLNELPIIPDSKCTKQPIALLD